MKKPKLTFIKKLDLGYDSVLEIVEIENIQYILKTYSGVNAVDKRNREFLFHQNLAIHNLKHFEFKYSKFIKSNQLLILYIEDFTTFASLNEQDHENYSKLGIEINKLITLTTSNTSPYFEKEEVLIQTPTQYYEWIENDIKIRLGVDSVYLPLVVKILNEFQFKGEKLVLIHSDFHANNIGLVKGEVIFFDSGQFPFLFGHKYHDLSRFIMNYPSGIIFGNELIEPRITNIFSNLSISIDDLDLLKFCFIQSFLVYNNPFVPRVREITDYLFTKLSVGS
jgi:hypothetical protein